jgi:hypothetical protein
LERNGRVFFGGVEGKIHELELKSNRIEFLSFFTNENKRLKKNNLQDESFFMKLLPQFLKFSDRKEVIDIKMD